MKKLSGGSLELKPIATSNSGQDYEDESIPQQAPGDQDQSKTPEQDTLPQKPLDRLEFAGASTSRPRMDRSSSESSSTNDTVIAAVDDTLTDTEKANLARSRPKCATRNKGTHPNPVPKPGYMDARGAFKGGKFSSRHTTEATTDEPDADEDGTGHDFS